MMLYLKCNLCFFFWERSIHNLHTFFYWVDFFPYESVEVLYMLKKLYELKSFFFSLPSVYNVFFPMHFC